MAKIYFEAFILIERLHKLLSETIKDELYKIGHPDITSLQAFLLYIIGREKLTVGEIAKRSCQLLSNPNYPLNRMQNNDYITRSFSPHDQRVTHVQLTEKGLDLFLNLNKIITDKLALLMSQGLSIEEARTFANLSRKSLRFLQACQKESAFDFDHFPSQPKEQDDDSK